LQHEVSNFDQPNAPSPDRTDNVITERRIAPWGDGNHDFARFEIAQFGAAGARMVDKDNATTCMRSRGRDAPVPADSRLSPMPASAFPLAAGVRPSRAWAAILASYRQPSHRRSIAELAITAVPFAVLWFSMWASLAAGYRLGLLLAVPTAGFLVRLFMIQHDCGHGSFFRHRLANDWLGRAIGVLTLTPYDFWRRDHAIHHATSGNLERRGIGDIDTLTVGEYTAMSTWGRLRYRLYRHPLVMFGVGPAYLFILRHRLPTGQIRGGWRLWCSTMTTNVAIALLVVTMMWLVGAGPFLLVQLPITLLAGSIGVWLFYVQHQFEDTYWARAESWDRHDAAVHGSSHYCLPGVLRWFTANIGVHHVHHLCSGMPFYRLPQVLRDHPELGAVGRLTLSESFRCVRLVLWDEGRRRLVSFRDLRRRAV
jgi:omega-6 fatty acid desaturase (delta-12 desaturase)